MPVCAHSGLTGIRHASDTQSGSLYAAEEAWRLSD